MRIYAKMDRYSDVSAIDTEQFGDAGIEINTRDGRTWSCLTLDAAIEQLNVLASHGVPGCQVAIASLEVEKLVRLHQGTSYSWSPAGQWSPVGAVG